MLWFAKAILFLTLAQSGAIPPINSTGAATNCDNVSIACTYTDSTVKPGQYFYFAVAEDSNGNFSAYSNVAYATVTTGQVVTLTWQPSSGNQPITYFLYRGTPATNLTITGSS
jgi:hypothetical protein